MFHQLVGFTFFNKPTKHKKVVHGPIFSSLDSNSRLIKKEVHVKIFLKKILIRCFIHVSFPFHYDWIKDLIT